LICFCTYAFLAGPYGRYFITFIVIYITKFNYRYYHHYHHHHHYYYYHHHHYHHHHHHHHHYHHHHHRHNDRTDDKNKPNPAVHKNLNGNSSGNNKHERNEKSSEVIENGDKEKEKGTVMSIILDIFTSILSF
jgi:hypothetical protein